MLGAVAIAALGCSTFQTNQMRAREIRCTHASADEVGYSNGRSSAPRNPALFDKCSRNADVSALHAAYTQGYERGLAEQLEAERQVYLAEQERVCDLEAAFETGWSQGYGWEDADASGLDACDDEAMRAEATDALSRGWEAGIAQYTTEICDPQLAYERGHNAAMSGQQMDSRVLERCKVQQARFEARRQFERGWRDGARERERQEAGRLAAARERVARAACDADAAFVRGQQHGLEGRRMNTADIDACPDAQLAGAARTAYRDGWAQGQAEVAAQARPVQPQQPQQGAVAAYPMDDRTFAQLLAQVEGQPLDGQRLSLLASVSRDGVFTARQARALLETFTLDNDRIEAAVLLYPRVVDRGSWFIVYDAFILSSSADEVRRRTTG